MKQNFKMASKLILLVTFFCLRSVTCFALEGRLDLGSDPRLLLLDNEMLQAFKVKDYARAEEKCREYLKINPLNYNIYQSLSNAEVLAGKKEIAFTHLQKAAELGFYRVDLLDADFNSMRDDIRWQAIIKKVEENNRILIQIPKEISKAFSDKDFKLVLKKCDELQLLDPQGDFAFPRAKAYAMLNMKVEAVKSLEQAVETGLKQRIFSGFYINDPLLANIKTDKRYLALVERAKVVEKTWQAAR